jgi:mRNA interferase HigB
MRVHLIKKQTIADFVSENARSRSSFTIWLNIIKYADWDQPMDIMQTFGSADLLGRASNRVVFDIGGNNYRMICKYVFGEKQVHLFVCWIGTHGDYDKLCKDNEQYTITIY